MKLLQRILHRINLAWQHLKMPDLPKLKYSSATETTQGHSLLFMLTVSMVLTSFGLLIISTVVFSQFYRNDLGDAAKRNSRQVVQQAASAVDSFKKSMFKDLERISLDMTLAKQESEVMHVITAATRLRSDLVSVMIFSENGKLLHYSAQQGLKLKPSSSESNLSYRPEIFDNQKGGGITVPHVQNAFVNYYPWVVSLGQAVENTYLAQKIYVVLDMRFDVISSYLDNIGIGQRGYCYLVDVRGDVVYHPQQQLLYSGIKKEEQTQIAGREDGVNTVAGTIISLQTLRSGTWRVVGVSYEGDLLGDRMYQLKMLMGILLIIALSVSIVIIIFITRKVTRPVRELVRQMVDFEASAENYCHQPIRSIREFQILSETFSQLVLQIQLLLERVKQEEITLRKTELKALQTQITPHFLYNTLDSILWMCEQNQTKDAVVMVEALSQLLRISISRGAEFISLAKEIEHAKSYLQIQSVRYRNQFSYRFEVDEAANEFLCNKITLQPLIENAIYHGIVRMIDEGEIVVKVKLQDANIVLDVIDNGIGMDEERIKSLFDKATKESRGIGIKNVHDRIQIYFGEQYGLTVISEPDFGTTVRIKFPQITEVPSESV